jgi:hypothetical protein
MPSCTLPIARSAPIPPESRAQRRGIPRVDVRTREGGQLREVRKTLREHLGSNPTAAHKALIERAAWLELAIALVCNGARRIRPVPILSLR